MKIVLFIMLILINGFTQENVDWEEFYSSGCEKKILLKRFGTNNYNLSAKTVWVKFSSQAKAKIFEFSMRGRFYDSMWIQYKAEDNEMIKYIYDDGSSDVFDGYQIRDCSYILSE